MELVRTDVCGMAKTLAEVSDVVNGPVVERIELPIRTLASVEAMAKRVVDDRQFRRALVSLLIT